MAALKKNDIINVFRNGPMVGELRLGMITHKIMKKSPFRMAGEPGIEQHPVGSLESDVELRFNGVKVKNAFQTQDIDKILDAIAQKGDQRPFRTKHRKKADRQYYNIGQLEKTTEFGGQGGGKESDPHEVMTAALILKYGGRGINAVPANDYSSFNNAKTSVEKLKSAAGRVVGSKPKEVSAFHVGKLQAYAQAVSAANGFLSRKESGSSVKAVYQTGSKWQTILQREGLRITNHKFMMNKDYNSSDLIVELEATEAKRYVGISLKKKGAGKAAADPTVINKTVMGADGLVTMLVRTKGSGINLGSIVDQKFKAIYRARSQFFFDVIEDYLSAKDPKVQKRYMTRFGIHQKKNSVLESGSKTKRDETQQEAIERFLYEKPGGLQTYIGANRIRGHRIVKLAQTIPMDMLTKSLKEQNPNTPNVRNEYFRAFDSLFMEPMMAKPLCMALLNIIFKTDLMSDLAKQRPADASQFFFTLITGRGDADTGSIRVEQAGELFEGGTTSILENLLKPTKTYQPTFSVVRDPRTKPAFEGGPAKTVHFVRVSGKDLAKVEMRYKGSITPEPQFQAYITPVFKDMYKKQYVANHSW